MVEIGVGVLVIGLGGLLGYVGVTQYDRYDKQRQAQLTVQKETKAVDPASEDVDFVKERVGRYVKRVYVDAPEDIRSYDVPGASKELAESAEGTFKGILLRYTGYGKDIVICTDTVKSLDELTYKHRMGDAVSGQVEIRSKGANATGDVAVVTLKKQGETRLITDIECMVQLNLDDFGITPEELRAAQEETAP